MILLLAVFLFGFPGLIMIIFLQWLTRRSYAKDNVQKHGISQTGASRLGGLAIFIFSLGLLVTGTYWEVVSLPINLGMPLMVWSGVFLCAALGFVEDIKNSFLSPKIRLYVTFVIFAFVIGCCPFLIPIDSKIPILDLLLALPIIGWMLTITFCVGFINATNMADGANGLMPGIITISFGIFFLETEQVIYGVLMTSSALFTIFNVISGRVFLGDMGAYGLGASLVLCGLYLFSERIFSAMFLAVLFAYPCIELVASLLRRRWQSRPLFSPDNDHLHNRIHHHCKQWFSSKTITNSVTGILIVSFSSGLALLGYVSQFWEVTDNRWGWIFIGQCSLYIFVFMSTRVYHLDREYADN